MHFASNSSFLRSCDIFRELAGTPGSYAVKQRSEPVRDTLGHEKSVWLRAVLLPFTALFLAVGLFRCSSGHCWLFYAAAMALERLLEGMFPTGGRRHHIIGVVTVSAIVLLFASTTGMYAMLHLLYPHSAEAITPISLSVWADNDTPIAKGRLNGS